MPSIRVELFEGRSVEQKRALAAALTEATVRTQVERMQGPGDRFTPSQSRSHHNRKALGDASMVITPNR